MRFAILTAVILGIAGSGGCIAEAEDGPPYVEGPVVYDSWYWGGYYDGPYWVYRDHDGHWYHERREDHDVRVRSGHFEGDHGEHRAEGGHFGGHEGGHEGGGRGGEGHR